MGDAGYPQPTEQARRAREYWNANLEKNPLRMQGGDTNAGAFLAWMLEAAGDIVRELGNEANYYDCGYIAEKVLRINRNIDDSDWRRPLSDREWQFLGEVKKKIDDFPTPDLPSARAKLLLQAIANREQWKLKEALSQLESQLGCGKIIPEKAVLLEAGVGDEELARALREDIAGELGAINQYSLHAEETEVPIVKKVLTSIGDEEKTHVGELLKLLKEVTNNREWINIQKGVEEVIDIATGDKPVARDPGYCKVVTAEPPRCDDFKAARAWVLCHAWDRMEKENLPALPVRESWIELRKVCDKQVEA